MPKLLSSSSLASAIALADLTNSLNGPHAMQILVDDIHCALADSWGCNRQIVRAGAVVPVQNNYDRLGYPVDGAARDQRYTRYVTERLILRTQTSSAIPDLLSGLSVDPPKDILLILPGIVYRRDSIDRLHCGEPHQLDLWRVVRQVEGSSISDAEAQQLLRQMISIVISTALPGMKWRISKSPHPYTEHGVQVDVSWRDEWIEVGECGVAARKILDAAQLHQHWGLAMGLGLDRLLMLRKDIPDIRLLRSHNPRVEAQMLDLQHYQPVSLMPPIRRDISICVDASIAEEEIGDRVRDHLHDADWIEALTIESQTHYKDLPSSAHTRMGMRRGQKNVLLRLTIRHMHKTLTDQQANAIRNKVYKLLHEGDVEELAADSI